MDLAAYDASILSKLETYEDYLSYYIQLDEVQSGFSWMKADLLLQMSSKLGSKSIEALSRDIKHPQSTIVNYTRTALAFPPEKRDPGLSFSAHFQASFADKYNDKEKTFESENRFQWLEKAADESLSTRALAKKIQADKLSDGDKDKIEHYYEVREVHTRIKNEINALLAKAIKGDDPAFKHLMAIHKFIYGEEK